ncbi:MAG: glycosyltransferase [Paludibacteraceae bacterium]|nr:glycosyltransferase [Paludibacteraceae bacterium]
MPKLLQINITANWGSTGKIAESIGLAAMKQGWESYIAYGRWCNPSKSHLIKVGCKLDMYLHYGEQRIRDNEGLCSRGATKRLIRQMQEIKPDVVQLHNIHDHYLNYRLLFDYLNQTDIKVVWTFHDCWAFTGHCFHFVTKKCGKWKTGCFDCPLKSEYPKTILDRSKEHWQLKKELFTGCENLTIVPVSDWMGDFVKQSFLRKKKIHVIKNGVDLNIFRPSLSALDKDSKHKFKILAVSSVWYPDKGELDIYKLHNMLSEDEFEITMVGLSAKQVKKLPSGIIGIQRTQNVQELVQLYSNADVLINPTYADTFPTVNLEALACGTPVITYRTGGSPEAIDDKTGVVINQGDVESLASTIMSMKTNPLSSEDCRMRAEKYFDKDKCFEQYIHLYNELLETNGK